MRRVAVAAALAALAVLAAPDSVSVAARPAEASATRLAEATLNVPQLL